MKTLVLPHRRANHTSHDCTRSPQHQDNSNKNVQGGGGSRGGFFLENFFIGAMWKKPKDIDGVSASSIVDLKAELFQKEQAVKRFVNGQAGAERPTKRRGTVKDVLSRGNKGVEARAAKDLAQVEEAPLALSQRKLVEKSRLYDKMAAARGDSSALEFHNDDEPAVDFELKAWQSSVYDGQTNFDSSLQSADTIQERERRKWEAEQLREENEKLARLDRQATLQKVISETKSGRATTKAIRERRKREQDRRLVVIAQRAAKRRRAENGDGDGGADDDDPLAILAREHVPPPETEQAYDPLATATDAETTVEPTSAVDQVDEREEEEIEEPVRKRPQPPRRETVAIPPPPSYYQQQTKPTHLQQTESAHHQTFVQHQQTFVQQSAEQQQQQQQQQQQFQFWQQQQLQQQQQQQPDYSQLSPQEQWTQWQRYQQWQQWQQHQQQLQMQHQQRAQRQPESDDFIPL